MYAYEIRPHPDKAPPVGRVLRILLGPVLILRGACLLPSPGVSWRGVIVADARVNRRL